MSSENFKIQNLEAEIKKQVQEQVGSLILSIMKDVIPSVLDKAITQAVDNIISEIHSHQDAPEVAKVNIGTKAVVNCDKANINNDYFRMVSSLINTTTDDATVRLLLKQFNKQHIIKRKNNLITGIYDV